jgi:hypothetical protein
LGERIGKKVSTVTPRTHSLANRLSGKLPRAQRYLNPGAGKWIYHPRSVANRDDSCSRQRPLPKR